MTDGSRTETLARLEKTAQRRKQLHQPGTMGMALVVAAVLVLFSVYPIVKIFIRTISDKGTLDLSIVQATASSAYFWHSFANSLLLGFAVAVTATLIGFLFAYSVTRTGMPGRRFFHLTAMLPIISPPFMMALALIILFGRSGLISKSLLGIMNSSVYGFRGLFFVQVMALFPLAYLNLRGVLESISNSLEDAGRSLGATRGKVFQSVTLPLCIPAIFSSILIVFIKSISDFGNPQVLGGNFSTLSAQAYLQINGMYNTRAGAFIAISILAPAAIAFMIERYWISKKSFISVTGKPSNNGELINDRPLVQILFALCLLLTMIILLFYGTVVWMSFVKTLGVDLSLSFNNFTFVFRRGAYIRDSLLLALVATPLTALFGMMISHLVIRKQFFGKRFIEFSAMLTFAVPGIVLGIGYILAFNRRPILLTGTALIIIMALVFRNMSIGIEAGSNSLRQIDPSIEEASANLGAGGVHTFIYVTLPMIKSALYTTLVNSFVNSMTSISAVIFLVSVNWNLLTVIIMSEVENSKFGIASAYCVVLMLIVLIAFGALQLAVNSIGRTGKKR
jgi:iron(III) transport system permease protein